MYGLIIKDFYVNRKYSIIFAAAIVLLHALEFLAAMSGEDDGSNSFIFKLLGVMVVFSSFYMIGMLQHGLFESDERKKWAYYVTSTEGGAAAQISAKYISVYLLCMGGVIICNTIGALAADLSGFSFDVMPLVLAAFFSQMLLRAIDIPFVVAFGTKRGNMVRGAVLVLGILAVVTYALYGDLSYFGNSMDTFWEKFFELFDMKDNPRLMVVLLTAALAVMPLYYLSCRLSCRLYLKGVDGYDK